MGHGRAAALWAALAWAAASHSAGAPESWVDEYPRVATRAEQDCAASHWDSCRVLLLRLYDMLDGRPDIIYRLAKVEARLGDRATSLHWLELYARSQLDFGDPAGQPEFRDLRGHAQFEAVESRYRSGLRPADHHDVLAIFPAADLIPEDLGLDPRDGSRYVSSVREGRVLRLDAHGHWSDFARRDELGGSGLYALAVDPHRDLLWLGSVAGAVSPPFRPEDRGRSAVLRVELRTRRLAHRYELADGRDHAFGDMALADGTVYVADGLGGGVYRIAPEAGAELEPVVAPGRLRSPQTPVPVPGGERLLVADYSRGIAIVNLRSRDRPVAWLAHPPELALYGIDGLYLHGRMLIAVQNGTTPERLVLLHLDPGFTRIVKWEVALSRADGLGDPTHGVIAGRQFQFIANSGWDRVDDEGRMRAAGAAHAPALWSIDLPE